MQIKTTMRYHLKPVRTTTIIKSKDNRSCWECGEKGTLYIVGGNGNWHIMESNMEVPQKIKNRTTTWSSNLNSAYIARGNENRILKRYLYFHSLFTVDKIWKQCKCILVDADKDKENVIYMVEYDSAIKKEGNSATCNNMDGPWGHYANWNKSDREKQILYVLHYMWNLKKSNSKK